MTRGAVYAASLPPVSRRATQGLALVRGTWLSVTELAFTRLLHLENRMITLVCLALALFLSLSSVGDKT